MCPVSDPIGDLLTRIRNAQSAGRTQCEAPWSTMKQQLCDLLVKHGWITSATASGEEPKRVLTVTFRSDRAPLTLERISKPGRRVYRSCADLQPVMGGFGISILSTNQGLLTNLEARNRKVGGELLCTIA